MQCWAAALAGLKFVITTGELACSGRGICLFLRLGSMMELLPRKYVNVWCDVLPSNASVLIDNIELLRQVLSCQVFCCQVFCAGKYLPSFLLTHQGDLIQDVITCSVL